ncbi:chemotaxis protein MotB [Vibrio splendidus]|jgi:outer membrane protein OmpA-like peptidoglycan-associated protein|uniref:OmpA family protein n=1 Tax=Vibrio splendidus TaxID=29497 RepID=A0AB35MX09_VIBSP|nr:MULTISPECIES: OmpA family protein [Vibrio]CAH6884231.1 Chemotaxis protein MotB [Vibrio chagasii]MDP2501062.1 OmpA family protein [Vibrio splendidus]NOI89787.1 OmpA family protein [Vibrio splendidus]OED85480.1 chemotaxis protein MotB [Vibrio crassostreae ZF-91]PME16174.1 chemotaxis protein MotB [Vibrio cyclitrophicus]
MRGLRTSPRTADAEESGVWLSIGDLMSVLLMIFALLLISALVQISEVHENSQTTRVVIIKGINDALEGAGIEVQANSETGDISILDSILFDRNEYRLKPSGKAFLDQFVPIYSDVIFQSKQTSDEVSRIVIEGHSSSEGSFDRNMELSVLRANSVAKYINSMDFAHKLPFFDKAMISGRGPIEANQEATDPADRKVKFRFQFKDDEFLGYFSEVKSVE